MSDHDDQEKQHEATPRRLEQAREQGQVPRSKELGSALMVLAFAAALATGGGMLTQGFREFLARSLVLPSALIGDDFRLIDWFAARTMEGLVLFAPLGLVALAAAAVSPLALGGWNVSTVPLQPDLSKLSPMRWLSRTFSAEGLAELGKSLAVVTLLGAIGAGWLWQARLELASLSMLPLTDAIAVSGRLAAEVLFAMAVGMALIAAIDVPLTLWRHGRELRMSTEELKREMRESDGDPHLKARIRSIQRERARSRMMDEVPKAQVVVTNPSHYAVALGWKEGAMHAPRVLAKGADHLAAKIRALADDHGVPRVEAPPLARALFRHAEIGDDIPVALYGAVAQVLAYVHQLERHAAGLAPAPAPLDGLALPEGMDPGPTAVRTAAAPDGGEESR